MYIGNHTLRTMWLAKKCQNGFHVKANIFYLEINTKTVHLSHFGRSISTFYWPVSAYYQTLSMQPRVGTSYLGWLGLKCSHITAHGIGVCERMLIRSQTLIFVRGTLCIRRVRSEYADIRRCTLCYTQRPKYFLNMFKIYQRMWAYRIYANHTHGIRWID